MNPIQVITQSRIRQLLEQVESVKTIGHNATIGHLREGFLIDFLKEILPKIVTLNTGIICDASGETSLQLDIIITDESYLPKVNFEGRTSIVPVESSFMFAEVKSNLQTAHLTQIENQIKSINELKFISDSASKKPTIGIHGVVLAFKTDINSETLKTWFKKTKGIIAICIINDFSLLRLGENVVKCINSNENDIDFFETLVFIGKLYQALVIQKRDRNFIPNWEAYMQGVQRE